jgi:hypothetical protein
VRWRREDLALQSFPAIGVTSRLAGHSRSARRKIVDRVSG